MVDGDMAYCDGGNPHPLHTPLKILSKLSTMSPLSAERVPGSLPLRVLNLKW